ncbi:hypothetical protein [Roseovarius sp.]|uniref:hypothetical protein n=1 Tax=Roseovarius sp. TaxID=1486281 RepID=UPI00257C9AB9|nr:hypothetical protein [Roseovarius sp.]|tara:strand:- start:832 stop:1470 length:639 start_codon:yes stop_codon:yes gene_type:complete
MPDRTKFTESLRYKDKLNDALELIRDAKNADELRDAWENYLSLYVRCLGRLITALLSDPETLELGRRIKKMSNDGDVGLTFFREARNAVEHGDEPFADFTDAQTLIGGNLIAIEGDASLTVGDLKIGGVSTGTLSVKTVDGRVSRFEGLRHIPLWERPHSIALRPVFNPSKRQTFPVPDRILEIPVEAERPLHLAEASREAIEILFREALAA